jgi:hypothetical protein
MIESNQCLELLIEKFPAFKESHAKYLAYWGNDDPGAYSDMFAFTNYVMDLILENHDQIILKKIFDYIEHLLIEGSPEVREAVTTCFLENLINSSVSKEISSLQFVYLLGKESKEYCKAWDNFSGIKTPGLWDDENI